jgi:UDP-N-acetylglucosamine 2-epimerase
MYRRIPYRSMLQKEAFCTLSDSGTLTEESSILGFPAVMLRQTHERPEGMDEGTVTMSGLKAEDVVNAIEVTTSQYSRIPREFKLVQGYDSDNVQKRLFEIS